MSHCLSTKLSGRADKFAGSIRCFHPSVQYWITSLLHSGMYSKIISLRHAKSIVQWCSLSTQHSIFGIYAPVLDFPCSTTLLFFPKISWDTFLQTSMRFSLTIFSFIFSSLLFSSDTDSGASGTAC